MIREAIKKIVDGQDLTEQEMSETMQEIMEGRATSSQIASFITALRIKGEKPEEILGAAKVMRKKMETVEVDLSEPLLDIVGTGGDGKGTFNISTCSAFVLAAGGVRVAKHGNRASSSSCGSADVLETLGAKIELKKEHAKRLLEKKGFVFLFAPSFHPSMKHAAPVRKEIGIRTIFNILGPIANPALTPFMLIGVSRRDLCEIYADVLLKLGVRKALIAFGMDGVDEITTTERTMVTEVYDGMSKNYFIEPEDFGIKKTNIEELKGSNAAENAEIMRRVLSGEEKGPKRDVVLLNSGFAFYIVGKTGTIQAGIDLAKNVIDSGEALKKLKEFIEESKKCS